MKDMQQSLVFSQPVVAVDDFNSDGKLDLAIVYIDDVGVHIMLGQENGTFVARSSPIPMRGSGAGPLMLGVGLLILSEKKPSRSSSSRFHA